MSLRRAIVAFTTVAAMAAMVAVPVSAAADSTILNSSTLPPLGDSGHLFGNYYSSPDPWGWYNQDVGFDSAPTLLNPTAHGQISLQQLDCVRDGSIPVNLGGASPVLSDEGIYTIRASGVDESMTVFSGEWSLGIDKTRPVSGSNACPVYDGPAEITITAADNLSGCEFIVSSVDGAPDFSTPTPDTSSDSLHIQVKAAGAHLLTWFAVDNAGNHEPPHAASFRVNPVGYVPVLSAPRVSRRAKTMSFRGSVTPASSARRVVLKLQRKRASKWRPVATFSVVVHRYDAMYWLKKRLPLHGTYRVIASEDGGVSPPSNVFRIK